MRKIIKSIIKHKYFLLILIVGLFLRVYKYDELFLYGHDQDLAGWFVRDVVFNRHVRLIGQETSTAGIYIGPLYYYLLIPFYFLTGFDPIGGVILITLLGLFSIWSVYHVLSRVYEKNIGLIASLLYATSYYMVFNDREVVPTMPVITWTVWFFYTLYLVLQGYKKQGYLLLGVLIALIWHLNFALILLLPLVFLAEFLSKKKPDFDAMFRGLIVLGISSLPLIVFELRHNFQQVRAFITALTTDQAAVVTGWAKFQRVYSLASVNLRGFLYGNTFNLPQILLPILFLLISGLLTFYKKIDKRHNLIFLGWLTIYQVFFSTYSKIVSEYYLNGMMIVWLVILSVGLYQLMKIKKIRLLGFVIIGVFVFLNVNRLFTHTINRSGYIERKQIVKIVNEDARSNNYPCVAISYITGPGYDLGYRYFLWLEKIKIKKPSSLAPVYTIVYPLRDDIAVDETAGAIGLIYPDYSSYNTEGIGKSCEGDNVNVSEPMWGMPI
ncbi:glycosyltransferase family 39 protein [Candidatus Woesebacteria bacterium]|nr:glycosyltransferase family 39 protein [Candidatus Woesebacteria bacterium]